VLPASVALNVNSDLLDFPVVFAGLPPHFCILPAIPPHMPRMATFVSCVSKVLERLVRHHEREGDEIVQLAEGSGLH
jgi:hypothetical protein